MKILEKPVLAAVIGHPIGHTMSPFIQKRLFELADMTMEYSVMDVPDLEKALPDLRKLDCFNITIPHKSAIIPYLDGICEQAELCGSVNTVRVEDGKLYGSTTDGPGFAMALVCEGVDVPEDVVILGNGGAAKAIAFQIAQRADFHLTIVHREGSYEKAMALSGRLADYARGRGDKNFRIQVMSYRELEDDRSTRHSLLVNTTSVGMYPNVDACPVSDNVIARFGAVFDAVYNPADTLLLQRAKKLGVKTVGGMGMLVCQAAYSHKMWYDRTFDLADLRQLIADTQDELTRLFGSVG